MAITRLSGGLAPGNGADPRTFPAIWNQTATDYEAKNIPSFGTAVPSDGQVLTYSSSELRYVPQTPSAGGGVGFESSFLLGGM